MRVIPGVHRGIHTPVASTRRSWGNAWFAQAQIDGERWYSGTCATMEEAVAIRDAYLEFRRSQRDASTDA